MPSARGQETTSIAAAIDGTTIFEGNAARADAWVTIALDRPATEALAVRLTTQEGTAGGADFMGHSSLVTIAPGEREKSVAIGIIGDTMPEPTETFSVSLSDPSPGLIIADPVATVTIHDDDADAFGSVLLNEVCAAPGNRVLHYDDAGIPRLGMGTPWMYPEFDDGLWETAPLPAGYGAWDLSTDLAATMGSSVPSLYLRKTFQVSRAEAASSAPVILEVDFDDGFVAYLNGVEVARANMGPPQHFIYAGQPAYNAIPSEGFVIFTLETAAELLVEGPNVLALQAHNGVYDPGDRNQTLTWSFKVNAGLRLDGTASALVERGPAGGLWHYRVGHAEPSGGVIDPALVSGYFSIPPEAEADFADPADFSDWVELRNMGSAPVDMSGWFLSDRLSQPDKWSFPPGTVIPGDGHLLILCDRREEMNGRTPTHPQVVVPAGSNWHYYDQIAPPPADWKTATFDHDSWPAGPAPLGYSPLNQDGAATVVAGGRNTHFTNYFRRRFTVDDPMTWAEEMRVRFQRDDGLVIWLNGEELFRDNMPSGVPGHATPAADNAWPEDSWHTRMIPTNVLREGDNVLAVEVHQISSTSSDVRFDLELTAWHLGPGMLHASFALDGDGEPLTLATADGALVDALPEWPPQDSFQSWGRSAEDPSKVGFQEATPGQPNQANALPARVAKPVFLNTEGAPLDSGFYATPQTVVLHCDTPGATIRYTLDGREPRATGPGETYTTPLTIHPIDGRTAAVLRARAFAPDHRPSGDRAATYLIGQATFLQSLPVVSLVAEAERTFYKPRGIFSIDGGFFDHEDIWRPGDIDSYNIPQHRGPTTERKTSVELIYPDGRTGFRDQLAVRISGSSYNRPRYHFEHILESPWRPYDPFEKGSLNLIWRNEIGARDLDFELLPGSPHDQFKQLRLRAGHNDIINPFTTDEYVRGLFREMGHDALGGIFVNLYVNGAYKGLFNLCERLSNETFQEHFNTPHEWDILYASEYEEGDAVEHERFRAIYDQDLSVPANYAAVAEVADLMNFADYYILNIYANMWDWATWEGFANNFVLYRERSPNGIWRFTVWDAEAGFGHQNYFNRVSYDLIAEDLAGAEDTNELALIWKRLVGVPPYTRFREKGNPEFRLLVADRIHRHLFNGGILDDRVATSRLHTLKDELRSAVEPTIQWLNGPWRTDWFETWTSSRNGRRTYLFGPLDTQFADAGVWPATRPPTFHQHGGELTLGEKIELSGEPAAGTVYYTIDGTDPRQSGGSPSPRAAPYATPFAVEGRTTVKARIRSASGEWSPLTEAVFTTPLATPTPSTLVVSEIMYHPPPVSAAEAAAGFDDANAFEFLRLTNIGSIALDLAGLRFVDGVTFSFADGAVTTLEAGESVVVVGDLEAFTQRYGTLTDIHIAGEYAGKLNNAGERLRLEWGDAPGIDLATFEYDDRGDWPRAADGLGASLLLVDPRSGPDPANPLSWTASAHPGGQPGGVPLPLLYEEWKHLSFASEEAGNPIISDLMADPDFDGLVNFAEYAFGGTPLLADADLLRPTPSFAFSGAAASVTFSYYTVPTALEAAPIPELSGDLLTWFDDELEIVDLPITFSSGHRQNHVRKRGAADPDDSPGFFRVRAAMIPATED